VDKYAHIPKANLVGALDALGIEIQPEEVDSFFRRHDLNGDGLFDLDEFKQAILTPYELPHYTQIRRAFDTHAIKRSGNDPALPETYISPENISNALQALSLKKKASEKVHAYFDQGALSDGVISFEEFNQAVLSICPLPDEQEIVRVYQENAVSGTYTYLDMADLRKALADLGVIITEEQLKHIRRTVKLNFNDCIKYNAFKAIVLSPSPMEVWAATLPFARLLADALPKHPGCDHLRVISSLTPQEADIVAEEVCYALKEMLKRHVAELKQSFVTMDEKVCIPAILFSLPSACSPHSLAAPLHILSVSLGLNRQSIKFPFLLHHSSSLSVAAPFFSLSHPTTHIGPPFRPLPPGVCIFRPVMLCFSNCLHTSIVKACHEIPSRPLPSGVYLLLESSEYLSDYLPARPGCEARATPRRQV
jgi:hypothetical protein